MPAVVRALEQALRNRLRRDHLAACGNDQALERPEQAARVAVGGDDDLLRVQLADRLDPAPFTEIGARVGCERRETPDPARRLDRPVGWVEHRRRREQRPDRLGQLVAPLDLEAVLAEQLVLTAELLAFLVVGGEPQTARAGERVAGQRLDPV